MLFLLVTSVLALACETRIVKAQGAITINADGSITPSTAPISTSDNVTYTLTGNVNGSVVVGRSNVVFDGAGYTVQGSGSGTGLYAESMNNVTIENVTVADFSVGIWANASSNCVLSNNSVTGNGEAGVYVETSSGDTLTDNDVAGNYEGIVLDTSSNNTLQANEAEGNPVAGIFLYYSANNTLSGNSVTDSSGLTGVGICLEYSSYNILSGNNATDNSYGIGLGWAPDNILTQNVISKSFWSNFDVDGSSLNDYINSVDASNLADGKPICYIVNENDLLIDSSNHPSVGYLALVNCTDISVENLNLTNIELKSLLLAYTTNCTITQNNIINNQYGIYLYSSANNTVSDNNLTAANQYYTADGIYLDSSFSNTVSCNNVTGNGADGIDLESSSDNRLSDNRVIKNPGGIGVSGANNVVSGNLVSGSISWGMWLLGTASSVVSGNIVTQNYYDGIILSSSSYNDTVSGNNVSGNYGDGIYLQLQCFNETVWGNVVSGNIADAISVDTCSNITVSCNNVTGNGKSGIALSSSSGSVVSSNSVVGDGSGIYLDTASGNTFYHNNFINNTEQTVISGSEPNTWDDGYPSGGNYWSDYNGTDLFSGPYQNVTGSDGIGDTPLVIDANNTDHYPLMNPYRPSSLSVAKTVVGQGFPLGIYFKGANYDDYPETFNITVYANTASIASQNVTLTSENSTITFTWNTTGFAYGNYTVSAYAWPVQNETNTANNNFTGGTVCVSIPGDLNGHGTVDIYDAIILAGAFDSKPSSSNWNPNADINGDGVVDIYDAVILAAHYGQTAN